MKKCQWQVAAASVRGPSHERAGASCQDAHRWALADDGFLVVAVADGAGSAAMSETGAATAVAAAAEEACRQLKAGAPAAKVEDGEWRRLLLASLSAAKEKVEQEAAARSLPASALATTIILVVARNDLLAAVQIGDGSVVAAGADGLFFSVLRPTAAEYLNETVFLTSPDALASAQPVVWRGPLSNLAVMSDGLQMVALRMPAGDPHPGFFTPLFQYLRRQNQTGATAGKDELEGFLSSPRLRERTDDDVTLVLAAPIG